MSNLKLGVEVISALDLLPKDKQNLCSAFVELLCDHQRFRTTTKDNDPNPAWNESFFFNVSDPTNLSNLTLEAHVYNHHKTTNSKSFLGKVRVSGTSFVPYSEAVLLHYPLEKWSIFSRSRGELGLRVFVTDDPSVKSSNPLPEMQFSPLVQDFGSNPVQETRQTTSDNVADMMSPAKTEPRRHTFHHLPNTNKHSEKPQIPQAVNFGMYGMKSAPQAAKAVHMGPGQSSQPPPDFSIKETSPFLGGGQIVGGRILRGTERPVSTYDLVEEMWFLYVRVVKARDLPAKDVTGSLDPFVEVKAGNYKGITRHFEKRNNPEWNEVFAFSKSNLQTNVLEVKVKDKDLVMDDFVGFVRFDLQDVPKRVPPDSPLAPEWYRLEDKKGEKKKGEIMLAVWYGTQADEAFSNALYSDGLATSESSSFASNYIRSKVYQSPRLWYVRVHVIEAQDLVVSEKGRFPDAFVKIQIGNQVSKTKLAQSRNFNPKWNEEFMFVTSEPFEDHLIISVEDRVAANKDESLGKAVIPLSTVERRVDDRQMRGRWIHLEKSISDAMDKEKAKKVKFATRLHLAVCLDGGYHVLDESTYYSSDLRPTARPLWKSPIGVLELGILNADGLHPMRSRDGRSTSDTYCVAKYGHKWVRTRTIISSLSPKYNEQYTWEVYDPATVLTIGVFDNGQIGGSDGNNKDSKIGKVRIRVSTLETGRVYTHTYPLVVLQPSGVKKMGELHLAIRFSCTSVSNMLLKYTKPLLPKMHYVKPLTVTQQDVLRYQSVNIVAAKLGRAEPPLRKEVIEYMSDAHAHLFSMRRSKANFFRLMAVFSGLLSLGKWFGEVCTWKKPVTTVLVHILYLMLVCFPEMILPTIFLYMVVIGLWNYRFRPRYPPHMNTRLSYADAVNLDELDEEFDTFPTTKSSDIVRMRYDRLRSVAGRIQTVVGDVAAQGERFLALLSWRDPRATAIFVMFCLVAAVVLYVTPFRIFALGSGFYFMRHPKFRRKTPSAPMNFFRRLPAMSDCML